MEFDQAVDFILMIEGGYVDDAEDNGGVTKYGISAASYPNLNIGALSLDDAKEIYRRDFWDKLHLDAFPGPVRLALFDSAINCGPATSIKFLQEAIGAKADGFIGPETLRKLQAYQDARGLVADIMWCRYKRVSGLSSFARFGSGWVRRMMKVIAASG